MKLHSAHLLLAIDLIGTALFAAEGATTAMHVHLDLLGIVVLAFVTALGGGILRDLLIGSIPPSAIRDWRYAAVAILSGALVFVLHASTDIMNPWVLTTLDAAGLAFFAVAGGVKALEARIHPLLATMMAGITGVGGGTVRDLLINRVPAVLSSDVYASAALLGGATTIVLLKLRLPAPAASAIGIAVCFSLRMVAVSYGWNLPKA